MKWETVLKIKNPFKRKVVDGIDLETLSIEDKIKWAEKVSGRNLKELRNMPAKSRRGYWDHVIGKDRMMAHYNLKKMQKLDLDWFFKDYERKRYSDDRFQDKNEAIRSVSDIVYYVACEPYETFNSIEDPKKKRQGNTPEDLISNFFNDDVNWEVDDFPDWDDENKNPYAYTTQVDTDDGSWEERYHIIADGNISDGEDRVRVFIKDMFDENLIRLVEGRITR